MTLNNNIYVIGIDPHDAYAMHLRHLSIYIFSESGRYQYSFLTIPTEMRQKYSFLSFANEEGCYFGMRG